MCLHSVNRFVFPNDINGVTLCDFILYTGPGESDVTWSFENG